MQRIQCFFQAQAVKGSHDLSDALPIYLLYSFAWSQQAYQASSDSRRGWVRECHNIVDAVGENDFRNWDLGVEDFLEVCDDAAYLILVGLSF